MSREDGFLDRWSRRKRAADAEPPRRAENPPEAAVQGADEDLSEEELLEKLGLPDPDTLKAGDDFKAFFKANIPDYLKKRALRRLWLSNPALANVDGLVDYGGDFTDAATVPDVLVTAYQVGRGFLRDVLDEAEQTPEKTDGINQVPEIAAVREPEADGDPEPEPQENVKDRTEPADDTAETVARPRRMAFRHD